MSAKGGLLIAFAEIAEFDGVFGDELSSVPFSF
jgi:hypothetical protein